ncbi:MAG: hypothetical protein DRP42_03795 [Tenericutes bacterium]|nr:MAG: hypothetical protein DRP42_03795 [Mycoplasmatota bacterium]
MTLPLALLALMALGTTAKIGSEVSKSYKTKKFNKKTNEFNESEKLKQDKKSRMNALANAIGDQSVYAPRPGATAPEAPDFLTENIIGGLGSIASQVGASGVGSGGASAGGAGAVGNAGRTGVLKGVRG